MATIEIKPYTNVLIGTCPMQFSQTIRIEVPNERVHIEHQPGARLPSQDPVADGHRDMQLLRRDTLAKAGRLLAAIGREAVGGEQMSNQLLEQLDELADACILASMPDGAVEYSGAKADIASALAPAPAPSNTVAEAEVRRLGAWLLEHGEEVALREYSGTIPANIVNVALVQLDQLQLVRAAIHNDHLKYRVSLATAVAEYRMHSAVLLQMHADQTGLKVEPGTPFPLGATKAIEMVVAVVKAITDGLSRASSMIADLRAAKSSGGLAVLDDGQCRAASERPESDS